VGVAYADRSGRERVARAEGEVVLASGAIGSPQLLMLSGIGEGAHLAGRGIEVLVDRPAVGRGLQDHLQARLVFKCHEPTLNDEVRTLPAKMRIALKYAMFRAGPMTMAASLAVGFMRTGPHVETPDIQFHVQPWSADSPGEGVHPFSAFTMSVCQLRPESRGEIRLTSSDPGAHPSINPNYLATETDRRTAIEGVRIARRIAEHDPLRGKIASAHTPTDAVQGDDAVLDWIRRTATTIYHPTGTCRMGADEGAVVDPRLRVRGVEGLRVADASIMPEIVSGNTNAPAIMIGEKAADLIREDRRAGRTPARLPARAAVAAG
jgi:choline dehydrogenase